MQKGDWLAFGAMLVLSAGFVGAAGLNVYQQHQAEHAALEKQVLHVSTAEVIGLHADFLGDPRRPYTLVEFGDYQCPPCRATNRVLPALLRKYQDTVRFEFRNLPLTSIHPYAMQAAVVAAESQEQGKFWAMHDQLYSGTISSFDEHDIKAAAEAVHLNNSKPNDAYLKAAQLEVKEDLSEADALTLDSTPSFVLCCPNGKVIHLRSIEQINNFVNP